MDENQDIENAKPTFISGSNLKEEYFEISENDFQKTIKEFSEKNYRLISLFCEQDADLTLFYFFEQQKKVVVLKRQIKTPSATS